MVGVTGLGCEPVPVVMFMWMGPVVGAGVLMKSLTMLGLVVGLKSFIFAALLKRGFVGNLIAMVIANTVSTVPGVIIGATMGSGVLMMLLIGLGFLAVAASLGARSLAPFLAGTNWRWATADMIAGYTIIGGFITVVAGSLISFSEIAEAHPFVYLSLKAVSYFVVLMISIPMTIGWELMVMAALRRKCTNLNEMLRAVVTANLFTFFIVFLIGAFIAFPHRMRRTDFLWLG